MRKFYALLLFLLGFGLESIYSQNKIGKISGEVHDGNQKGLQSATISLHKAKDSSIVKFTLSNKTGEFEFDNIGEGKYMVSASSVGYEKSFSETLEISISDPTIKLKPLQMQESAKGLKGVTVTGIRPFIETRIDKTIVNVDALPSNAGATALEVLEKSPGVMVNNDGIISLRGKSGVIVMMDGKPTFLSPTDLANLLKNMPASAIDQIEIMTNPSAKYDASGNSGIINIKTKKGKAPGFNGSVMAGITTSYFEQLGSLYVTPKSQNSITFNYRKKKINFFGNYNPNVYRGRSYLQINRKIIDQDHVVTGFSDVETKFKFGNNNHTLKLGLDYFANKKNTFGIVVSGFTFSGHPTPVTVTTISDANYDPVYSMLSLTENKLHFRNLTSNFNFRHLFDTAGRELTGDLDFIAYSNTSNMLLTTDFYDGSGQQSGNTLFLQGHLPSNIKIYSAKFDYVHPLKNDGRFEAGIKSSYVTNNNLVDYNRFVADKWQPDSRSNHFIYDENINAAYINVNKQIKKWSFQAGLRVENTIAKGYQVTNDSSFKRNMTDLFPTLFISNAVDKNNQLTLSYGRRITRPNYQDLNPFIYFLDSLSYRIGNPFLLPQFTNNIELSHSFKGKFITTLNYNNTKDVISQILKPKEGIVFLTVDNVAKFINIGVSVTAPITITKWWNANLFTNVYNNHYKGLYNTKPIDVSYTSFMVNMTNTFIIKKGFSLELSGWYRARGVDDLTIDEPMYIINFAGQKQVLKGKGTIRLNLRDPFWLQRYQGTTKYDVVDTRIWNKWDNRQITTTFTYRFGKNGQQPPPRHRNQTLDEQNRVGQGGQ